MNQRYFPGSASAGPDAPASARQRRRRRRMWQIGAVTAIVAGITAASVGLAEAQNNAASTVPSVVASASDNDPGALWGHQWDGWAGSHEADVPGIGSVLHGQGVAAKPGGGTETVLIQRGAVTSVSGSVIALKSADGFTATYQVTSATQVNCGDGTVSSIATGTQVLVIATANGSQAAADEIIAVDG